MNRSIRSHCLPGRTLATWLTIFLALTLPAALCLSPAAVRAAPYVLYVDIDATGANNGTSWGDAFTSLQDALMAAVSGQEIWVAAGTYTPGASGERSATFTLKNGVAIYGGFAGGESALSERDWKANAARLSGDLDSSGTRNNNDAYHVVSANGVNATAVLDGFKISYGNAVGSIQNADRGGGIYLTSSSPTLNNLLITDNHAAGGGGMHNTSSSPTLTSVTFYDNTASNGGGMYNDESSPVLNNLIVINNTAANNGGGMFNDESSPVLNNASFKENSAEFGGGMFNVESSPKISNANFHANSSLYLGGGMYNYIFSSPSLTEVTFSANTSVLGGGMANQINCNPVLVGATFIHNSAVEGGGLYNSDNSSPVLTNVSFNGNFAIDGGAMYNIASSPVLTNLTLGNNSASGNGGGIYNKGSSPQVRNSILWGNTDADYGPQVYNADDVCEPTYSHTIIQGGSGSGVTNADPLFVDADGPDNVKHTVDDNLRLQPGSPAIDGGENSYLDASITTDLDGNPRIVGSKVDLGAYEYQTPVTPGTVSSFEAAWELDALTLRWTVAGEAGIIGFNIFRSDTADGHRVRVNADLILVSGTEYTIVDPQAQQGQAAWYWLEVVRISGSKIEGQVLVPGGYRVYLPGLLK